MHYNNAGRFYHHIAGVNILLKNSQPFLEFDIHIGSIIQDIYPGPIDDKSFTMRSKTEPPPKDLVSRKFIIVLH